MKGELIKRLENSGNCPRRGIAEHPRQKTPRTAPIATAPITAALALAAALIAVAWQSPRVHAQSTLVLSTETLSVEKGKSGSFQIKLTEDPQAQYGLRIDVKSDPTGLFTNFQPGQLTFRSNNWDDYQTVTFSVPSNTTRSSGSIKLESYQIHNRTITVTLTNPPPEYEHNITLSGSDGFNVTHDQSASFGVRLKGVPAGNATVTLTGENKQNCSTSVSPASLTFNSSNWNAYQNVTLTAKNKGNADSERCQITFGGDDISNPGSLPVDIRKAIALTPSPTSLRMAEGTTKTFTLRLASQPRIGNLHGDRIVSFASDNPDVTIATPIESGINRGKMLFNRTAPYNVPQTVTLTATADSDSSHDSATISMSGWGLIDKSVNVTVLEAIALTLGQASLSVDEGDEGSFTVKLAVEPDSNRTVNLTSNSAAVTLDTDPDETGDQSALTFTPVNWNTPQTVKVRAATDADHNDGSATISLSGTRIVGSTLAVTVRDPYGLSVDPASVSVVEGSSTSFDVKLTAQPSGSIAVSLSSSNPDVGVTPNSITFTSANWNTARSIAVTTRQDDDWVRDTATITLEGSKAKTTEVAVTVREQIPLVLSKPSLDLNEGTSTSFTVRLGGRPNQAESFSLESSPSGLTISPATLSFTPNVWNSAQTVTVRAPSDGDSDDESWTLNIKRGSNTISSLDVDVKELISMSLSRTTLNIQEGASETLTVRLGSQPQHDRTVNLASADSAKLIASPTSLTFTGGDDGDWNTPKTVTLTAKTDSDTTDESVTVSFTGVGLTNALAVASIYDGIPLTLTPSPLALTEGGPGTFSVKLAHAPRYARRVTLSTDSDRISFNETPLDFTVDNWSAAQNVRVSSTSDADANDDTASIDLGGYGIQADSSLTVTLAEPVGLTVTDEPLTLFEGSAGKFKVRLASRPPGSRTVQLKWSSSDLTVSPTSLDFTADNWSTDQEVEVTAAVDGNTSSDTHSISLTGSGITAASASVTVNEVTAAARSANSMTIDENTALASFTYVLESRPPANRTIQLASSHADLTMSTAGGTPSRNLTLTFTPANWNIAQSVTLSAASDTDADDRNAHIDATPGAGLIHKSGVTDRLSVLIRDKDTARSLILSTRELTVIENRSSTFRLSLGAMPAANTSVTMTSDNPDVRLSPAGPLLIQPHQWSLSRDIQVIANPDADGLDETATISFSGPDIQDYSIAVTVLEAIEAYRSRNSLIAGEGTSTTTFTYKLDSKPSNNRTIKLDTSRWPDLKLSTGAGTPSDELTLTFTPDNWSTAQSVSLVVREDEDMADVEASVAVTLGPGVVHRSGVTPNLTVHLYDKDVSLVLSKTSLLLVENGNGGFTVKLKRQPLGKGSKTVTLTSDNADVTLETDTGMQGDQVTLTFNGADDGDWDTAQAVTVRAAKDADGAEDRANISLSGDDVKTASVSVDVTDDDPLRILLSESSVSVNEHPAGTKTIDGKEVRYAYVTGYMSLEADPLRETTVELGAYDTTRIIRISDFPWIFYPTSSTSELRRGRYWNQRRRFFAMVLIDDDTLDNTMTLTFSGTGLQNQSFQINLLDTTPVKLTLSKTAVSVDEGGSATFTVRLASEIDRTRTVNLASDNTHVSIDTDPDTAGDQTSLTFSDSDWNIAKTVTIKTPQDANNIGERATISFTGRKVAYKHYTIEAASLSVQVEDDEPTSLTLSDATLLLNEDSTEFFTVQLASQPSSARTINLASDDAHVSIDTDPDTAGDQTSLSFTADNWDIAQAVNLSAGSGAGSANISLSGAKITGASLAVTVTEVDDTTPKLLLTSGISTLAEGASASFTVKLSEDPGQGRTAKLLSSSSFLSLSPASLSFTAGIDGNWDTPQTVTVSAPAHAALRDDDSPRVSVSGAGLESAVTSLKLREKIQVKSTVMEGMEYEYDIKRGSVLISEGGSFTISYVLGSKPITDRTVRLKASEARMAEENRIRVSPSDELRLAAGAGAASKSIDLTFTSDNWNTPQTVTVSALQDSDTDDEKYWVSTSYKDPTLSGNGRYVIVIDDERSIDVPNWNINALKGSQITIPFKMNGRSLKSQYFDLVSDNPDFTISPTMISFGEEILKPGPRPWYETQMLTVTLPAAAGAGDVTVKIKVSRGAWPSLRNYVAPATITVNGVEPVVARRDSNTVSAHEGDLTPTFSYVLESKPTVNRTITLKGGSKMSFAVGDDEPSQDLTLTFTPDNWSTPQTVKISIAHDDDSRDETIILTPTLDAGLVHKTGVTDGVTVQVIDDDVGLVTLPAMYENRLYLSVDEGGSKTFSIQLAEQPPNKGDRTLTIASRGDQPGVTFDTDPDTPGNQSTLTFTGGDSGNWGVPQSVTVSAAQDGLVGTYITDEYFSISGVGIVNLGPVAGRVRVEETDTLSLTVSTSSLVVNEGESGTFTVKPATSQSKGRVTICVSSGYSRIKIDTNSRIPGDQCRMLFTAGKDGNWDTPRTVTVTSVPDNDDESSTRLLSFYGQGRGSKIESPSLRVTVPDGITWLTLSKSSLEVDEGGSASFTVRPTWSPGGARTVALASDSSDLTLSPTSLDFDENNWQTPQSVTVTAASDSDLADESAKISLSGTGVNGASLKVAVRDTSPVPLFLPYSSLSMAAGGHLSFGFRTRQALTVDETLVTVTSDSPSVAVDTDPETAGNQSTLTLSAERWQDFQNVALRAGSSAGSANISFSGAGIVDGSVAVTVVAGSLSKLVVSSIDQPLTWQSYGQDRNQDTFTVRLASKPDGNRTVSLASSHANVRLTPETLTFTPANWQKTQSVTVRSSGRKLADETVTISLSGSGIVSASTVVEVLDSIGLSVTSIAYPIPSLAAFSFPLVEGRPQTYGYSLKRQPRLDRTVRLSSAHSKLMIDTDPDTPGNQDTLTFTSRNWNTPQIVSKGFAQDADAGDEVADLDFNLGIGVLAPLSSDRTSEKFFAIDDEVQAAFPNAPLVVLEGERGVLKVKMAAPLLDINSDGLIFTLKSSVTLTLRSGTPGVTISPSSLTFTGDNWDTAQDVTVSTVTDSDGDPLTARIYTDTAERGISLSMLRNPRAWPPKALSENLIHGLATVNVVEPGSIRAYRDRNFMIADEGTSTSTFSYVLTARPDGDKEIQLRTTHDDLKIATGDGAFSRNLTLTFTPDNWDIPQTVKALAAEDDDDTDRNEYVLTTFGANLSHRHGVGYRLRVLLRDNDSDRSLIVSEVSDTMKEGDEQTFTVHLGGEPESGAKTVELTSNNADVTLSPTSLSFDSSNWRAYQSVTITSGADANESDEIVRIHLGGADVNDTSRYLTVLDSIEATRSTDALTVKEGSTSATFTYVLGSKPLADRTISLSTDHAAIRIATGKATPSRSLTLTFTPDNWDIPQSVAVSVAEDADSADASHNITTRLGDSLYQAGGAAGLKLRVNVIDNDRSLVFSELWLDTLKGVPKTFKVSLKEQLTSGSKTISLRSDNPRATVSPTSLTFDSSNWSTGQTVTVTSTEDDETADTYARIHFTGDGFREQWALVTLIEPVKAYRSVNSLTVEEGTSTASFSYVLDSRPGSRKSIQVVSSLSDDPLRFATGGLVLGVDDWDGHLIFTRDNWDIPQTVTVSYPENSKHEADRYKAVLFTLGRGVSHRNGVSKNLMVVLRDNDSSLVISETPLIVVKGTPKTFKVSLKSQPQGGASTVSLSSDNPRVTLSPASLTFDSSNWSAGVEVTINTPEDRLHRPTRGQDEAAVITLTGDDFEDTTAAVRVIAPVVARRSANVLTLYVDDDEPTAAFSYVLESKPERDKTIELRTSDASIRLASGDVPPGQKLALTFTSRNWDTPQSVTVSCTDACKDAADSDEYIDFTLETGVSHRSDVSDRLKVLLRDSEIGLGLSRTALSVKQGGSGTFTVRLADQPKPGASRTVNLASDNSEVAIDTDADAAGAQTSLTFTSANWSIPQSVTLTSAQGNAAGASISLSGADITAASLALTVLDAAAPELIVTSDAGVLVEGGSQTLKVRLASAPSARITVDLTSDNPDVTLSPSSLDFTASDWSAAQSVTATASIDLDRLDEATTIAVSGSGAVSSSISLTVLEEINFKPTSPTYGWFILEGTTRTASYVLESRPSTDRTVQLTADNDKVRIAAAGGTPGSSVSLTFTPANWSTAQTVSISAVQDSDVEMDLTRIRHALGAGLVYQGSSSFSPSIGIHDDDLQPVLQLYDYAQWSGRFESRLCGRPSECETHIYVGLGDALGNLVNMKFGIGNYAPVLNTTFTLTSSHPGVTFSENQVTTTWRIHKDLRHWYQDIGSLYDIAKKVTVNTDPTAFEEGDTVTITVSAVVDSINRSSDTNPLKDWLKTLPDASVTMTYSKPVKLIQQSDWYCSKAGKLAPGQGGITGSMLDNTSACGIRYKLKSAPAGNRTISVSLKPQAGETPDLKISTGGGAKVQKLDLTFTPANWSAWQDITFHNGSLDRDYLVPVQATIDPGLAPYKTDFGPITIPYDPNWSEAPGGIPRHIRLYDKDVQLILSDTELSLDEGGSKELGIQLGSDVLLTRYVGTGAISDNPDVTATVKLGKNNNNTNYDIGVLTVSGRHIEPNGHTGYLVVSAAEDDDGVDETATLTLSGFGYQTALVKVTVADPDTQELVLSDSSLKVDEGENGFFTVKLATEPTKDVTVTLTQPENPDVRVDTTSLTFTADNWETTQTVTVLTTQDGDAADDSASIALSASGGDYDGFTGSVAVEVADDSALRLVLSKTALPDMQEGGSDTFTVALSLQPAEAVTLNVTSDNADVKIDTDPDTEGDQTTLTFNNLDATRWDIARTVTVSIAEDFDSQDDEATITLALPPGDDRDYIHAGSVTVYAADNDLEELQLSAENRRLSVKEGETAGFDVQLASQPIGDVSVTLSGADNSDITLDKTSLTFTVSDWNTAQTVTASAAHDDDAVNDVVSFNIDASGGGYDSITSSITITAEDDDDPELMLSDQSLNVDEGGSKSFSVELMVQPVGPVKVRLSEPGDLTLSAISLEFSASDWNIGQSVMVHAGEDSDSANDSEDIVLTASGGGYLNVSKKLAVTITDRDSPRLVLDSETLEVNEDGASVGFTVKLGTQPGGDVEVALAVTGEAGVTLSRSALSFSSTDWDTAQSVQVTAGHDDNTGNESATITLSAAGSDYRGVSKSVAVTVIDDDDPELTLSETGLLIAEGGSGSFTVRLASRPNGDKTVNLASDNDDVTLTPASVDFSVDSWETPQEVSVSAATDADGLDELVSVSLSGAGVISASLPVEVIDSALGLTLSPETLTLDEGSSKAFTVQLASRPLSDRSVQLASDNDDVTLSATSLSFGKDDWDTPQEVTLSAAWDADPIDDKAAVSLSGDNLADASLAVTVSDDGLVGLVLSATELALDEGAGAELTVKLFARLDSPRTVTLTPDSGAVSLSPASLEFTASNWSAEQSVTVKAEHDDDGLDGAASIALGGDGITGASVQVAITDDDDVEVVPSARELELAEGASAEFTVRLSIDPGERRAVVLTSDNPDVTLAPSPLTFTPGAEGSWRVPQTVTVTAEHDDDREDDTATITLAGDDITGATLAVTVSDDDKGATPAQESMAATVILSEIANTLLPATGDTIRLRFGAAGGERTATVAGQPISLDRALARDIASGFAGRAGLQDDAAQSRFAEGRFGAERQSVDWLGGLPLRDGRPLRLRQEPASSGESGRSALLSSFSYALSPSEAGGGDVGGESGGGGAWSLWGRIDTGGFSGTSEADDPAAGAVGADTSAMQFDGSQSNVWLGFDRRSEGGMLSGVAFSSSSSDADYTLGRFGASMQTSLSIVVPYIEIRSAGGASGHIMLGLVSGEATLSQTDRQEGSAGLSMYMMLAGGSWPAAQLANSTLSWSGDLGYSALQTAEATLMALEDISVQSMQLRGGVQLVHNGLGASGAARPRIGLQLRHDSGDGVTGTGVELTAGLQMSAGSERLSLDLSLRTLAVHSAEELGDWGAGLQLSLAPRSDGGGLEFALGPTWGAASGDGLLGREDAFALDDAERLSLRQRRQGRGMTANLGYRMHALGGLLTPYSEYSFSSDAAGGSARQVTGVRFRFRETLLLRLFSERQLSAPAGQAGPSLSVELERQF